MGQKNCSIKNEDELVQIIGNYRVTSDLEWLEIKAGIENRIQKGVFKDENSNSLESFSDQNVEIDTSKESKEEILPDITENTDRFTEKMNQSKSVEVSKSVTDDAFSNVLVNIDENSTTQYNCSEKVEETEMLATDSITESVDIRISPRNSTVELINFEAIEDFPTEFSLVADVEIKMDGLEVDKEISTYETPIENNCKNKENAGETKLINFDDDCDNLLDENTEVDENKINATPKKHMNGNAQENRFQQINVPNSENVHGQKKRSSTGKRETRNLGNGTSFTVESKIAQEIKEMKQREEDLRKMREILSKEILNKPENTPIVPKNGLKVEPAEKLPIKIGFSAKEKTPAVKTQIVNGQSYNIASVFGQKRKDSSKQIENSPKVDKKTTATYESPIEREIRIVKQREEELKREREHALKIKQQLEACLMNPDLSDDDKETIDTFASVSICSDSSFDSGTKQISPDQKHYDESISPTTMNNKINTLYYNSSNAASICSLDSISQNEKNTSFNGLQKIFSQNKDVSFNNNFIRTPSPDSSSSSSISKMSFPFNGQKSSLVAKNKNVNMEKFIASKGKQIVFKNSSPNVSVGSPEYFEIKPPQVKKSDQMSKKKFLSAASKIQSELQEMKEREEELRKERARLLGLNGKLSDLTPETNDINHNKDSSTDICSSPDFLENDKEMSTEIEKEESMDNQTRRRSTLIEQWEQRIQKSGVQT